MKHRLRFERESFRSDEEKPEKAVTLEAVYMLYLEEKQFNKKSLSWQMDAMRLPLDMVGQRIIADINKKDLEAVLSGQKAKCVKSCTVHGRMSVLRTVLRWAAEKGFCAPISFPKLPPAEYEKLVPPTLEELVAIMLVAPDHIQRVIILGAQCGTRVGPSELFQLEWRDVDLETRLLRIKGARKNINATWREVPIRESLFPLFVAWRKDDLSKGISYIIHYNGNPVRSIKTAWKASLKRAGIERRIRPYDLRHTFATELIAAGSDIGTIAKLMGHSGPAMLLKHYQYVLDKQKRAAVEALPDLGHVPNSMCPKKGALQKLQ